MNNGALPYLNKCWSKPLPGSIESLDTLVKNGFTEHCSNVIIIPSSNTPLTGSSVSIAKYAHCHTRVFVTPMEM
jgi:hypothetical protein